MRLVRIESSDQHQDLGAVLPPLLLGHLVLIITYPGQPGQTWLPSKGTGGAEPRALELQNKGGVEITPSEPQTLITCVGNPSFPTKVIWLHIWLLKLSLKFAQVLCASLTSQSRPSVHEGRKGLPASLFPSPHQPSEAI